MKILLFIFILTLAYCSVHCFAQTLNSEKNIQIGPIKLGYTTIEEAKDSLHSLNSVIVDEYCGTERKPRYTHATHTRRSHKRKRLVKCWKAYYYEYYLIDSTKGLSLNAKCKDLHVIYEVKLWGPNKFKTAEGFGIGSSFEEIKAKMGPPKTESDTLDKPSNEYSVWHRMTYDGIEFHSFHEMNKSGGCCVDLIIISTNKITRPNAGVAVKLLRRKRCPKLQGCTKC